MSECSVTFDGTRGGVLSAIHELIALCHDVFIAPLAHRSGSHVLLCDSGGVVDVILVVFVGLFSISLSKAKDSSQLLLLLPGKNTTASAASEESSELLLLLHAKNALVKFDSLSVGNEQSSENLH